TSNIFNSIACSAFILLTYNPLLIMDVGFQLSYLAVLGIVYLQPKIYRLWEFNSVFIDWVWQITAVSLAAQLVTFPLGALYFHQFPTYFLVSNLLVIPASTIMLYGGIGLLLISWIPVIPFWVGTLLEYFTWAVNELLMINLRIPGALIEGIYLEVWETWLIFAWLGCIILLLERKRFNYLVIAFLLMCIGSVHASIRVYHIREQKGVFVYQIPKKTAIEWVNGENSVLLTDIDPKREKGTYRFHIQNNHVRMGIRYTEIIPLDTVKTASLPAISSKDYNLIKQQGQLWLIVKQYCPKFSQIIQSVHPSKVVFIRKGLSTLKDFQQEGLSDLTWIADGSVSPFSVNRVAKSHF
ncbi:MAG: ComEC/Rec2 family competence protein, partial [Cytophagales bacterium]|nr:ComEC/Rec2 family competence protein [Cytophagales bacterium]